MSATLGDVLREARERQGLSLRQLGRKTQLSATYLSNFETHCKDTKPSEATIYALATVLNLDEDELCCLAGRLPAEVAAWALSSPTILRRLRKLAARTATPRRRTP